MKKIKELIDKLYSDFTNSFQETMNHKAWLLHWILIQSFINNSEGLFGTLLCDKYNYGTQFLSII